MKTFALIALAGAVSALTELESAFISYIAEFGKTYNSVEEFEHRLAQFAIKHEFIQQHDAEAEGYTVAHNKMSDWTHEEYKAILTRQPTEGEWESDFVEGPVSASGIDWRSNGCVNAVKDQGQCGSCWAFSAVASTEGAWCISKNRLYSLSEQELVSCDTSCYGCNGGWADKGINWFKTHNAMTESSYKYTSGSTGRNGSCTYSSSNTSPVKTTGYGHVTAKSPSAMQSALNSHVLSVAIEADQLSFQLYSGGVFSNSNCGTNLDHATNVVGWNSSNNTWIMRNSWGTSWGDKGYMNVEIKSGNGICGIQMEPQYANV